jgi:hypothetical protein
MQTQKFGVDAFDALFSKSIEFQKYVTNIETAVKDKYNTAIWSQWYPAASAYDDGDAVKVIEVIKTAAVMLDGRARYSEFTQADHDGASSYSCSLPDFGKGFFYTMQDKEKIDKLNQLLGANGAIIDGYTDKAINLVEGAYGTLDVMALQLTSNAEIDYTYGMGINYKQDPQVPAGNKQKSGTLVWSDVNALILDRMHEAEKYLSETLNYTGPVKLAVMPLVKKDGLPEKANEIINDLKFDFRCQYDEKDSIGKRYRRQDAIGTPFCITVDHDTLNDNCVTIRFRDTMLQERVPISKLHDIISEKVNMKSLFKKIGE